MKSLFQFLSLILVLSFVYSNCKAQKIEINTSRAKDTYYVGANRISRFTVKQEIESNADALKKFKTGEGLGAAGIATCATGVHLLAAGIVLAVDNSVKNEELVDSEKKDNSLAWTFVGTGIGTLMTGAILMLTGKNQRIKAVKSYNETVDGSVRRNPVLIKPATRGLGLSLHF